MSGNSVRWFLRLISIRIRTAKRVLMKLFGARLAIEFVAFTGHASRHNDYQAHQQ